MNKKVRSKQRGKRAIYPSEPRYKFYASVFSSCHDHALIASSLPYLQGIFYCLSNMLSQSVPLRKLGKNGPSVAAMGFGLMGMSGAYGTIPGDEERFRLLDRAHELGETFWDTAE
jgi:hypothetical protein